MKILPRHLPLGVLSLIGALALTVATVNPALAITTDEVITLTKLGISPDEVIKAIEKDKTVFTLSVTDILNLKKAGVDEKVLKFMLSTKQRYGGGNTGTTTDPTVKPNTPPVPAELTPEQKAERERKMRVEAERLMAEKKRAEEAQRKAYAKGVLGTGRALAKKGKFVESIQAYQSFVQNGQFKPDSEEAYLSKFGIAEALVEAGLFQSAAKQLVEVLLDGPEKPFFQTAFKQLRRLRKKVNYSPPDLEELTKFFVGNFSQAFQCEYNYVLGEFFYDYSNWTEALKYLGAVTPRCVDHAKAQYLKGLVEIRNQLYKSAVQSFQSAIVSTEENQSNKEVSDLAYMALARIAAEVANWDGAIYYYRKVPKGSYKAAQALYESGWVYFQKGDASRALGTFQTLHSPYFKNNFYPELWILEATVYMTLCRFVYAQEALVMFERQVLPLGTPLKQFLLKTTRPEEYYKAIVATVAGKKTYGLPPEVLPAVLSNVEFYNLYQTVKQIEAELKKVTASQAKLGGFGADLAKNLARLQQERVRELGIRIQRILKETEASLTEYGKKLNEVRIDLEDLYLDQQKRKLRDLAAGREEKKVAKGEEGGSSAIVGSDSWEWPFEGEYWADEIGYHRAFVTEICPVDADDAP